MNKEERVYVYIDGSNLYYNLKRNNCSSVNFDFKAFIDSFVGDRRLEGVRYYIGHVIKKRGDLKRERLYWFQKELFCRLRVAEFHIVKGRIRRIGNVFTEKGVDVRIAIDLVEGAYENHYDKALLVSSDGDLAPAIDMVRRKNKAVEIVSFKDNPSYSLIQKANYRHFIGIDDLQRFVAPQ